MWVAIILWSILLSTGIFNSPRVGDARLTVSPGPYHEALNKLDEVWSAHQSFEETSLAGFETRAGAEDKLGPAQAEQLQESTIRVRQLLLRNLRAGYRCLVAGKYFATGYRRRGASDKLTVLKNIETQLVSSGYHIAYLDMEDGRSVPAYRKQYLACCRARNLCLAHAPPIISLRRTSSRRSRARVYPLPLDQPGVVNIEPHLLAETREQALRTDAAPQHAPPR